MSSEAWAHGIGWGGDGKIFTGSVNIWVDPAFANPNGGNYLFGSGSAAIDAGMNASVTTDIDGDPRSQESGYEIGANEFVSPDSYLPLVVKKSLIFGCWR